MARPLGIEQGTVYELVAPDGSRAVINDPSSPDCVGFLTGPPTGLEGGAIRENAETLPEADGGVHGAFYSDRMAFTLSGIIDARDDGANVPAQDRLLRATRALRADGLLRWTPSTIPEGVQVAYRAQQRTRITNRRPKAFLVAGVAEDPFIYSQTLRRQIVDPGATGAGGFSSPLRSPLTSGAAIVGQASLLNDGSADSWPLILLRGPCTNPSITNATTGLTLAFTFTLAAGEYLLIDTNPRRRSVRFGVPTLGAVANEVTNPSLEVDASGHAPFRGSDGLPTTTGARQTGWSKVGAASLRMTQAAVAAGQYIGDAIPAVACAPGEVISARATLNVLSAGTTTAFVIVEFFGAGGAYLGGQSGTAPALGSSTAAVPRVVDLYVLGAVAPAGTQTVRILPHIINGSGGALSLDAYVDAVRLVRGNPTLDDGVDGYVDGDSAGYAWEGVPHASRARAMTPPDSSLANRFNALDYLNSRWWPLVPGINDIRIAFASYSLGAQVLLDWRDAWG